jgi:hypothetical protein
MSFIPLRDSITPDDFFVQIRKYTSHFDLISSDLCAKVLAAPIAP